MLVSTEEKLINLKRNINFINTFELFENLMNKVENEGDIFQIINIMTDFIVKNKIHLNSEEFNNLAISIDGFINHCNNYEFSNIKMRELYQDIQIQFKNLHTYLINKVKTTVYLFSSDHLNLSKRILNKEYLNFEKLGTNINDSVMGTVRNEITLLIIDKKYYDEFYNEIQNRGFDKVIIYEDIITELYTAAINQYYRNYDYNFLNNTLKVCKEDKDINTLIVGLSYSLFGVEVDLLKEKSINLSLASQDIYYSLKIIEDVINENKSVKNCIIGTAYYSFHFDLSRGSEAYRITDVYYPLFKDTHYYQIPYEQNNDDKQNSFENFVSDEIKTIFDVNGLEKEMMDIYYSKVGLSYFNSDKSRKSGSLIGNTSLGDLSEQQKIALGTDRAISHNKVLKYEETLKENVQIFAQTFKFLNENGVKPIIVVFPTTSYYKENLSPKYKEIFYDKMKYLKENFEFEIIDLFDSNIFNENDCLDLDHLDKEGAIKVTNILNERLFKNK
ncbi:hypothetical protein CO726_22855 [Bacillus fungorum]|uniref:Chemotaxis protein n=1 Tax=Bacillus fungorum TaxID=2039284 RepID=A0A2G6Q8E5_9BACI|nr:hypothetical protein [Bacillus fungorum]PIE93104.1 hypothetical protein CO726_22855 [Bacillus fungorum]